MADTGWKSPTATGITDNEWTDPTDAYSSDNNYATITSGGAYKYQDYYDFDFGVPGGAIIDGIEVAVEHKFPNKVDASGIIYLYRENKGSVLGSRNFTILSSEGTSTCGGAADGWGENLVAADLTNTNFRLKIGVKDGETTDIVSLDHIQVKIYYTLLTETFTVDGIIKATVTHESLVDSYNESNRNSLINLNAVGGLNPQRSGQSFTGDGTALDRVTFYLKKSGSPTGNAVAEIYAHTGTFGAGGKPTGSPLATSGVLDSSTLTTSYQLIDFTFTGANKIRLVNGTKYFVVINCDNVGNDSNPLQAGIDSSSPTHDGNAAIFNVGSGWLDRTWDMIFYVYGDGLTADGIVKVVMTTEGPWTVQYEADALPQDSDPEWIKYIQNGGSGVTESVSSGILNIIADYSMNPFAWIYYMMSGGSLSDSTGYTIQARIKMESFGSEEEAEYFGVEYSTFFDFWDDVGYGAVLIASDRVNLFFDEAIGYYEMDASDGYHTYRVTVKNGVATLYVDGIERIQLSSIVPWGGGPSYEVTFGNWFNISGGAPERSGTNDSSWDYVYYRTDGAFPPFFTIGGSVILRFDKTLTTDGLVVGRYTKTFTADGIMFATGTKSFTAEGLIVAEYYRLSGLVLPRPALFERDYDYAKQDVTAISGKTGRDLSGLKEKFIIGWDYLSQTQLNRIIEIVEENTAVTFVVDDGNLVINETNVMVFIKAIDYEVLGDDLLASTTLELVEVT